MTLLVDSTFVIDHLRGDPGAESRWDRLFREGRPAFLTEVVVCEVRAGLHDEDEEHLVRLLRPMELIQPGPETALLAGRWRHAAHRRGRRLSLADALIAAAADAADAAVLTRNVRDFALTPVRIETY